MRKYKYFDVECPYPSRCGSPRSLQRPQSPHEVETNLYQNQQQLQLPEAEAGVHEGRGDRLSVSVFPLLRSLNRGNDDNDDDVALDSDSDAAVAAAAAADDDNDEANVAATGVNHDVTEF